MGPYWINLLGIVAGLGMIGSALAYRKNPNSSWRFAIIGFSLVILVTAFAAIRQNTNRHDKYAHIGTEQDDLMKRINALQAEMANDKSPADPAVVKERAARLEALQRDLNAIRKESDDLKKSN